MMSCQTLDYNLYDTKYIFALIFISQVTIKDENSHDNKTINEHIFKCFSVFGIPFDYTKIFIHFDLA